ncbi:MAG: hypothetical protein OXC46_08555 [Thaumarchaeota archaeon]|nr:hypothetical protein [Nitrososphaerota archaeon]
MNAEMAKLQNLKDNAFFSECLEIQQDDTELDQYIILFKNNFVNGLDLLEIISAGFRINDVYSDNGIQHVTVEVYRDD